MELIPAIDIIDGKCVRLKQGDYGQKTVYNENPLEVARQFEDAGIHRLHLVDLDGAKAKKIINYKVLETIASRTHLIIDFGGGIQSDADIRIAFNSGALMVTGGSIAIRNEELFDSWLTTYGPEKIILGADAKDEKIAVSGWQETTGIELIPFLQKNVAKGIVSAICTDISKDGMMLGPSIELYKKILAEIPTLKLIASGGVTTIDDLYALAEANLAGAIFGKAIYEGSIKLKDLQNFNAKC
jgi:phosphoribosylformimino-5-aminoimidazole carboxamide ribotide isomerase